MRPAMIVSALAIGALLVGCGDKDGAPAGPERRSAAGEVLGGEVTDAMIPLDKIRSTSPPAPRPIGPAGNATSNSSTGESDAEDEPDAADGAEPAAEEPDAAATDSPAPPQP